MNDQHDKWAEGKMTPDDAARFEREARLDDARQWMANVPGLDRADQLAAPRLPVRTPRSAFGIHRWWWQMAAAASIFAGGVCIGRISMPNQPSNVVEIIGTPPVVPVATPGRSGFHPDSGSKESGQSPDLPTKAAPHRQVRQEDGRLIIDTTLADSGARATWVIDGSFKLAANETKER